jgi:NADPH:quinone reductase-like Zn-dependent oxidoreductase
VRSLGADIVVDNTREDFAEILSGYVRFSPPRESNTTSVGVSYSFLFMQANGGQLRELASLYDAGHLRPLVDKTFPFDQTLEARA